ncbi:uncharacterized protein [Apostichopus japonicus]|uniref:uncharacterized protein isoform X2 n=1 Tax=Stichopus japonicus TaxID=307972 RepID=UPI003AB19AC9
MGRSSGTRARKIEARQENGTTDPERRAALDAAIKRRKEKLALNKQKSGMNGKNGKKDVKVSKKGKRNIQSSVNTVDECLAKALESIDTFNFDQAKKFCKKAIELDPRNLKALELYGDILAEEGEIEKAMECFNKAIEIEPNAGFAKYMYLGQLSEGLEAVKQYEKGVHIMEEERDKHNKMQEDQASGGDCPVSNIEISQAYTSIAEIYLTDACFEDNAEQRCKECLDRAVEENVRNAEAHQLMASYWLSKDDQENAKASIETSLSLWVKEEEDEETKMPKDEAEGKYPMTYPSRIECAKILIELEEYDKAESVLCGLLEESDQVVQVWYMLGLLQVQRKTEESKPYGRYYLNKANKVFKATRCGDRPVLEHIVQLLKELGPGEGEEEGWLEKSQIEEEDLKELDEEDEEEDSSEEEEEEETEVMEP